MKKALLIVLTAVFLIAFAAPSSFAHENHYGTGSTDGGDTYVLSYPGMLPDNPIYFLKSMRDGFVGFLISDPLKKAEFDLLQADKMVSSGVVLATEKKKQREALSAFEKGQSFYESAVMKAEEAKQEGVKVEGFAAQLVSAGSKHANVMHEVSTQTKNKTFDDLAKDSAKMRNQAEKLRSKNK